MVWRPLHCIGSVLLCASLARAEPRTWEYSASGKWTQSQPRPATQAGPNLFLDNAERLIDGRRYEQAHDLLLDWVKKYPRALDRDRGLFLLAQTYYATGDRLWCFYQCDELLDNYPESKLFFPAMELQYKVADAYMNGYRKKFLGLSIVPMEDSGIDMLFRIQERSPGSPLAERAMLRTGDYYYQTSEFALAADVYGAFLRLYPRSAEVPRVRLRQAYANFAQFRGPKFDATPLLDARAEFQEIIARTPDLASDRGVQQFIERIDEQLAAKLMANADYYRRVGQPKAAVFLYRTLVQRYPNSRDGQAAKKILARMPASALSDPPPPRNQSQLPPPTTRPTLGP